MCILVRSQFTLFFGSLLALVPSRDYPNTYVAPNTLTSHLRSNAAVLSTSECYTLTPLLFGYILGARCYHVGNNVLLNRTAMPNKQATLRPKFNIFVSIVRTLDHSRFTLSSVLGYILYSYESI